MPDVEFVNLLAVMAVAAAGPLLLGLAPGLRVPAVVLEILAGVVLGPSMLGWVESDLPVQVLALLGLAFLLLLAGLEVRVDRFGGRLLPLAVAGYAVTLLIGGVFGVGFHVLGWVDDPLLVAVALSATSLGLVVPVLEDARQSESDLGQTVIAAASVADFAAVLLLSLLFSMSDAGSGGRLLLVATFALLVVLTGLALTAARASRRLGELLVGLQDTTAEIRVRATAVLLVGFVVLAERFGVESILGAFLAGALLGMLDRDTESHPRFRVKLEAIGYGFLIPVFFVNSGLHLDIGTLLHTPAGLAQVPLFLLALLAARGLPALLYTHVLGQRSAVTAGLLQATSLPFIVTVTQIGLLLGALGPVTATGLVCAGLLSVLLFPAWALGRMQREAGRTAVPT